MATEAGAHGIAMATMLVQKFSEALIRDMLPDSDTEQVFATRGNDLYGAITTLRLQGRYSKTMFEQALTYSATSYPEYIQLWIRSLPPGERSMYAADLYNNSFPNITWDDRMYTQLAIHSQGSPLQSKPPSPLGDDRHSKQRAKIQLAASMFHTVLNYGVLFESTHYDAELVNDHGDHDDDILLLFGPYFGVTKPDLVFGQKATPNRVLSTSERVLRVWNCLYFHQRLSKTELEYALLQGPQQMRALFQTACERAVRFDGADSFGHAFLVAAHQDNLAEQVEFVELTVDEEKDSVLEECDYCGTKLAKSFGCGKCKKARYCNKVRLFDAIRCIHKWSIVAYLTNRLL